MMNSACLDERTARLNIGKYGNDRCLPLVRVLGKSTAGGDTFERC